MRSDKILCRGRTKVDPQRTAKSSLPKASTEYSLDSRPISDLPMPRHRPLPISCLRSLIWSTARIFCLLQRIVDPPLLKIYLKFILRYVGEDDVFHQSCAKCRLSRPRAGKGFKTPAFFYRIGLNQLVRQKKPAQQTENRPGEKKSGRQKKSRPGTKKTGPANQSRPGLEKGRLCSS